MKSYLPLYKPDNPEVYLLDYNQTTGGTVETIPADGTHQPAGFNAQAQQTGRVKKIDMYLQYNFGSASTFEFQIRAATSLSAAPGAVQFTKSVSSNDISSSWAWHTIIFDDSYLVTKDNYYGIYVTRTSGSGLLELQVASDTPYNVWVYAGFLWHSINNIGQGKVWMLPE